MSRRLLALSLFALSVSVAAALPPDDKETLMQLERDWAKAALARDVPALDKMLGADYILTDGDGAMISKKQSLDALKAGSSRYETFVVDDMKVYLYDSAAVVLGKTAVKGMEMGRPIDETTRFTDTWVKKDGRWVCVATQVTRIAK